jgi:hypothetical protein
MRPDIQRFRIELLTANIMEIVSKYVTDHNDAAFNCRNEILDAMLKAKLEWSTETDRRIAASKVDSPAGADGPQHTEMEAGR